MTLFKKDRNSGVTVSRDTKTLITFVMQVNQNHKLKFNFPK